MSGSVVVIGGTAGLGKAVAKHYAKAGRQVVIGGRDAGRAATAASEIGGDVDSVEIDLSQPSQISQSLSGLDAVEHLVIAAMERDENSIANYDVERAVSLVTTKLVGYTAVVSALLDRMGPESSTVLFGGMAKDRPYPGSTTVTTVNGGISTLIRTMVVELAPRRFNALHPAVVGDHPYWMAKPEGVLDGLIGRTPLGKLVTTEDIVGAVVFLLENQAVNGVDLRIDGGWLHT